MRKLKLVSSNPNPTPRKRVETELLVLQAIVSVRRELHAVHASNASDKDKFETFGRLIALYGALDCETVIKAIEGVETAKIKIAS